MTLYLGDAFGWQSDSTTKVAISQLDDLRCPKLLLIKNGPLRAQENAIKILGYIPIINIIAGSIMIAYADMGGDSCRSHNKLWWICRGIATIFTGPLLFVVDLVKFIIDSIVALKYISENKEKLEKFNTLHKHSHEILPWAGHPAECVLNET